VNFRDKNRSKFKRDFVSGYPGLEPAATATSAASSVTVIVSSNHNSSSSSSSNRSTPSSFPPVADYRHQQHRRQHVQPAAGDVRHLHDRDDRLDGVDMHATQLSSSAVNGYDTMMIAGYNNYCSSSSAYDPYNGYTQTFASLPPYDGKCCCCVTFDLPDTTLSIHFSATAKPKFNPSPD